MKSHKGLYIAFDGGEGGGKSTMVKRLVHELRGRGQLDRPVHHVVEPGGTALGQELRRLLLDPVSKLGIDTEEELLLMSAARSALMRTVIRPALDRGEVVVADRTTASTFAYQIHGRRREDLAGILASINRAIVTWPDLLLIFDIDPVIGLARVERRGDGKTRFDAEVMEFHQRVRTGFMAFAAHAQHDSCLIHVVDASRTEEEVWAEVLATVDRLIEVP